MMDVSYAMKTALIQINRRLLRTGEDSVHEGRIDVSRQTLDALLRRGLIEGVDVVKVRLTAEGREALKQH